jgi:hypothetical protein
METFCSNCGQLIKNIVTISGKPYGTKCAEKILGVNLPHSFSGSWEKHLKEQEERKNLFEQEKEITRKNWGLLQDFSKALKNANNRFNNWERGFIHSISNQVFGGTVNFEGCHNFEKMEDAVCNWKDYQGSFPYLNKEPHELTPKQKSIFERILNS